MSLWDKHKRHSKHKKQCEGDAEVPNCRVTESLHINVSISKHEHFNLPTNNVNTHAPSSIVLSPEYEN